MNKTPQPHIQNRSWRRFEAIRPLVEKGMSVNEIAEEKRMTYSEVYSLIKRAKERGQVK